MKYHFTPTGPSLIRQIDRQTDSKQTLARMYIAYGYVKWYYGGKQQFLSKLNLELLYD